MVRHFLIAKHGNIITATELDGSGSQATFAPVLRFTSLPELTGHFSGLGVTAEALQALKDTFQATGLAKLEFAAGTERVVNKRAAE
jgi:hypothetical protein